MARLDTAQGVKYHCSQVEHLAYQPGPARSGTLLALALGVGTAVGPAPRTRWIHVAPEGEWQGHAEGSFKLTRRHFEAVVSRLKAKRTPCSVDYEHASIRPTGNPTPAAGFVLDAEIRPDGLWCLVECTERSDSLIRAGEYRFCSGVFDFAAADPVTGDPLLCVLDSIALTNRPFIDGQTPIACTSAPAARSVPLTAGAPMATKITRKDLDGVLDMFKLKEFTPSQLMKALEFVASMKGGGEEIAAGEAAPAEEPAESADLSTKKTTVIALNAPVVTEPVAAEPAPAAPAVALAEPPPTEPPPPSPLDALMSASGLDADAFAAAVMANLDAIVALLTGAGAVDASVATLTTETLKEQVVALSASLSQYRKSDEQAALDEVSAACADGRLLPAQRATWTTMAKATPAATRAALSTLPKNALLKPHAAALSAPTPNSERLADVVVVETDPVRVELSKFLTAGGHKPGSPVYVRAMGAT